MERDSIAESVKRKIIAESMGRCMNPNCPSPELFKNKGDIIEKAHIVPYCDTANNCFENLIILCPNCHTDFDKNHAFSAEETQEWKKMRQEELKQFFSKKYNSFEELKVHIKPLLEENKTIFENYYINEQKELWEKFEPTILKNNRIIKTILLNNINLIQESTEKKYSNKNYIQQLFLHIEEFEQTRTDKEKYRQVLFPEEVCSMFGVAPKEGFMLPMTESLELFIDKIRAQERFDEICLGEEKPYISYYENGIKEKVYLTDTPRLRQLYFDNGCFMKTGVRLDSLNFALKYIKQHNLTFTYIYEDNLRMIEVKGVTYCTKTCIAIFR
ncbi:MAG: HNH endonuclease signature motif containing protein [Lachnotalea sp.]